MSSLFVFAALSLFAPTDETGVAIQRAIDAANAAGGGRVALKAAVYPSGTSDVFAEGMLPSVYSFLDLPEDTTEFDYSLYKGKYGNCTDLDFAYTLGETEFRESYTVSLDFGLVVAAKTYQNEELVYELETEELSLK